MSETIPTSVQFNFTKTELEALVGYAVKNGFLRVEPGTLWSGTERKMAARFAVRKLTKDFTVTKATLEVEKE